MASWCIEECVDVAAESIASCALPFSCAFLYCLHHCSSSLQCCRSDWYINAD